MQRASRATCEACSCCARSLASRRRPPSQTQTRRLATMVERLSSGNHPGPPPPPQQPVHTVPHHTSMTSTQMPSLRQQPSAASPTAALPSFYKRPLPASCVAFDSTEGKQLFRKAMQEGNMENYFALAQSFLTQNEVGRARLALASCEIRWRTSNVWALFALGRKPAYCGLAVCHIQQFYGFH